MSGESISLYELLNVSIGTPQVGAVNFGALRALLRAVLEQLDIQQATTRWSSAAPGDRPPDAAVAGTASEEDLERGNGGEAEQHQEEQQEEEDRDAASSPTSSSSRAADPRTSLLSRLQSCEEDLSEALALVQQLQDQSAGLRGDLQQLQQQTAEVGSAAERCRLRVDALEDTVRSPSGAFHRHPEQLGQWVTWEDVQSALLGEALPERNEDPSLFQEHLNSKAEDPDRRKPFGGNATDRTTTVPPSSSPAGTSSAEASGRTRLGPPGVAGAPERHPQALEALRDLSRLRGEFGRLQARVVELEDGKLGRSEPPPVSELVANTELRDAWKQLLDQLTQQKVFMEELSSDQEKNKQLLKEAQTAFLQLQARCEKLGDCSRNLLEENRERESRLQELLRNLKELEEKKADRRTVQREIKAEKSALESKVSRLQLDSEQLGAMLKELLDKVSGQEQDWHRVAHRLSGEMDCKLNRAELDSVKKQLENRWKDVEEKLRAQEGPEGHDAAALRKQLVDRFHCLSCDRPVVKYAPAPHLMKLPSTPGFPAHRSVRPFTVYALEQFRQRYGSERISGLADCSHVTVARNCGGSHTVNSASQRRQSSKHYAHAEVDLVAQSEEVDIVGLDGHVYRGRLSAPPARSPETTLPAISAKEGLCKAKDKVINRKPPTSPEAAQGASAFSRCASSSSGRDRPVSPLGCAAQTSFVEIQPRAAEPPGP